MKNNTSVIVWGGTGQCQAIIPILEFQGYNILAIFDKTVNLESPYSYIPIYLDSYFDEWIKSKKQENIKSVIAIGNPYGRERIKISNYLKEKYNIEPINIIDRSVKFGRSSRFDYGIQALTSSNIREKVYIGKHCILNCNCLIEHNCILNDGVEIGPGAIVCGNVTIEDYSWIGAGATILPRIRIGKNCIIGAGSVVTKNIYDNNIVIGNPARFMRYNND